MASLSPVGVSRQCEPSATSVTAALRPGHTGAALVSRLLRRMGPLGVAITVGQAALVVRNHWNETPQESRARLAELVKRSGGRPSSLSEAERRELSAHVRALRLGQLGGKLAASAGGRGRRRR